MVKKITITVAVILIIAVLLAILFLISLSVKPSPDNFEITVSPMPDKIVTGEEVKITATLKNKKFLVHRISHSTTLFKISQVKKGDSAQSAGGSNANFRLIYPLQKVTEVYTLNTSERGDYELTVKVWFNIKQEYYTYEEIINFTVE